MKRSEILGRLISEMTPGQGTPTPGKVQKINPDGTAEIVDAKGTVTKVNQKDIAPDATDPNKLAVNVPKPKIQPGANVSMTAESGDEGINAKSASYILRKLEAGVSLSSLIGDFPELSRMIDNIAGERGLHGDDDFEEIENVLMNDLEDIASQSDGEDDYYESTELDQIKKLSGLR